MEDRFLMGSPDTMPPALDRAVLEALFAMGDETLRAALGAQLEADFARLRAVFDDGTPHEVGRAAHELKGLAATVGAARLAEMARSVDAVAEGLSAVALAAVTAPLKAEISAVLVSLAEVVADTPRP
ncbi:Hpt domain-containing protein [Pararhodobacter aggregans]|uniref:Hpt domain-containing protein n=1 Tax=Pararhodobacter aggregans TaxID=404875 RepID=UPI003A90E125